MSKYTFFPLYLSNLLSKFGIEQYHTYRKIVTYYSFVNKEDMKLWYENKNIFFIVSTGRTGTKWLSNLLNKTRKAWVVHEPVPGEAYAHREAFEKEESSFYYIKNFRQKEIFLRCRHIFGNSFETYGEVNGNLRRHVDALKNIIPNSRIIHLVRNGIDIVRSVITRDAYSDRHPVYNCSFRPLPQDPFYQEWGNMTRFQRICWMWMRENEYMRKRINKRAHFEDILSSYTLFREQILEPLGLNLEEAVWQSSIQNPQNVTKEYTIGKWKYWTQEQQEEFIRICGQEMQEYGYTI